MSEEKVTEILKQIKLNNDKKLVYKLLVKIRTEIIKDDTGIQLFYTCGGIKNLIHFLNKPYEKILEVTLSILGNCCMQSDIAKQACELGIISPVLTIITNIPNPNIQGRGCRLLGNLAQNDVERIKTMQEYGIAEAINSILQESNNTGVLMMTIRLIKYMWQDVNFQAEIISLECICRIMELLLNRVSHDSPEEETVFDPNRVKIKTANGNDRTITRQKFNTIFRDMDAYEKIISHKVSYDNKFLIPKENDVNELIGTILRCFLQVTGTTGLKLAQQFYLNGKGYCLLVYFGSEDNPFRIIGLKILSNLVSNSSARAGLGSADVIILATKLLTSKTLTNPLQPCEIRYCIRILCLLTGDSCNRAKIRHSGALNELLKRARLNESDDQFPIMLYAFYQFRFDEKSVGLLVDGGLIPFLIKKLVEKIKEMKVDHEKSCDHSDSLDKLNEKKRAIKRPMKEIWSHKSPKQVAMDYEPGSPSSSSGYGSGPNPHSPTLSAGSSPRSTSPKNLEVDTDLDSESYSPVCSDAEEESNTKSDNEEGLEQDIDDGDKAEDFDIFSHIYGTFTETESNQFMPSDTEDNEKSSETETISRLDINIDFDKDPVPPILILLHKASMRKEHSTDFVRPETLTTLIKLSQLIPRPLEKLSLILENILSDSRHFVPIIHQNFIYELSELKRKEGIHENCKSCTEIRLFANQLLMTLGVVGESGYGRGQIAHILFRGEIDIKKRVAIMAFYIIKRAMILKNIIDNCNALEIVLNCILNDDSFSSEASCGLTTLAVNLNIGVETAVEEDIKYEYYNDSISLKRDDWGNDLVTFIVIENETTKRIEFCKKILINNSDVFNSMFSNDYIESKQKEIKLIEVSENGLKYFLHLLTLKSKDKTLNVLPKSKDMNSALDVYELSIKYMLFDIEIAIFKIIKKLLSELNVINLFEWSWDHENKKTLDISINYFLNSNISGDKKTKLFRNAIKSRFSDEWNQLIRETIIDKVTSLFISS